MYVWPASLPSEVDEGETIPALALIVGLVLIETLEALLGV
jgi:hypothetical protein